MTLTSFLKIFGWLLLTSSLCMADSKGADSLDPNMRQFFEQDQKRTQSEYCARCAESAMTPSSTYGLHIDVRAALEQTKPTNRQATKPAISSKENPNTGIDVNLDTSSFDQETARLLAEKIKSNSVSAVSTIRIFYREDLASMRQAILRQIREAFKNQSLSQGSSSQGSSGVSADPQEGSSIRVGDYVKFNGQKVRIEMYSFSDEHTNTKMQLVTGGGKPKLESSYHHALDSKSQIDVSSSLAGSKCNSISIQFVRAWD